MPNDSTHPKGPLPPELEERMNAYEKERRRLDFSIPDELLNFDRCHDIAAAYVKAGEIAERFWIVTRPKDGTQAQFLALNPAVAFALATAIQEQGAKIGWYQIMAVDGVPVPKIRQ